MRKWICMLLCLLLLAMAPVAYATEATNPNDTSALTEQGDPPEGSGEDEQDDPPDNNNNNQQQNPGDGGDNSQPDNPDDPDESDNPQGGTTPENPPVNPATCEHTYSDWTTVAAATCQTTGTKRATCSKCSAFKEETIPVSTTHSYNAWGGDTQNHSRTCAVCGKLDSDEHSWGTDTVVTAATCKEDGVKSNTCSVCSQVRYVEITKLTTHTYDNNCDDTCNVCESKREAGHKFADVWTKEKSGHWYACLNCGEKKEHFDHVPGPAATEYREQTCLTCGYVMTAKLNHVHNTRKEWKSDKQGHWRTCSGCDVELDFSKHNYGTGCEGCKECGYVDPSMHIYDGVWELDRKNHWGTCTVCGQVSELQDHIPGPEATEEAPQTCTVCGYVIAEYQEHEHKSTGAWHSNDADHWNVCECGEKLDVDPHIWDSGTKNKDKTITYKCAMCDAVRTEAQQSSGSSFPWGILLVVLILLLAAAFGTLAWILLQPKQSGKFTQ